MRARRSKNAPSRSRGLRAGFTHRITLGTILASALVLAAFSGAGHGVSAQDNATGTPVAQKKYKATRPLAIDRETRQLRLPTLEEVDQTVQTLLAATNRPSELPEQASAVTGAVEIDLGGGFAGVVLARPNDDGTWETRCVFTFEEGIDFLGLVPDAGQQ